MSLSARAAIRACQGRRAPRVDVLAAAVLAAAVLADAFRVAAVLAAAFLGAAVIAAAVIACVRSGPGQGQPRYL